MAIRPKLMESYLSKRPPCPGNIFPVSLILSNLLKYEIVKSPAWATIEKIMVNKKYLKSNTTNFKIA